MRVEVARVLSRLVGQRPVCIGTPVGIATVRYDDKSVQIGVGVVGAKLKRANRANVAQKLGVPFGLNRLALSLLRKWLPPNCTAAPFESVLLNTGGRKPEA